MDNLIGCRVLVTGAGGFVGANLVRELLRLGAEVHALTRRATNQWRISEIIPRVHLHLVDLTCMEEVQPALSAIRPAVIFHLAAQGALAKGRDDWHNLRNNVLGTANLLEALAPLDYRRFVHLGGSSEYGLKSTPIQETDYLEPVTVYGASKAATTLLCQQHARANRRPIVVLRPFPIYGYWDYPTRLIPTAIRSALGNREITLTAPGYRRDFIFIEDVVAACLAAAQSENVAGEIINVGSGTEWSNEEVVELVQAAAGRRVRVLQGAYPARTSDNSHWVADVTKARRLLGWQAGHTLQSGIEKTVAWFRTHHATYGRLTADNA